MDDQNKKDKQDSSVQPVQDPVAENTNQNPADTTVVPPAADTAPAVPTEPESATSPESPVAGAAPATESEPVVPSDNPPTPIPAVPDVGYTETKSNKMIYILVFVLMVILFSLVGLFFYKQLTSSNSATQISPTPAMQVTPTDAVTPTVTPVNDEEAELQQIEIPDIDRDLQEIETDLEQL